jgi:HAD superfamily hydrolase (TIGR01549 family)
MTTQQSAYTTDLNQKTHWIFDMDGTLTHAIHDFEAIKTTLDLPTNKPILESLQRLPEDIAAQKHQQLDEIELLIAQKSTAAEGAEELLSFLQNKNCVLGIVTRNNKPNIKTTLKAAGLLQYFPEQNWISRDCAEPKPSPDGIQKLLRRWNIDHNSAVMVGDHAFDLAAGRAANISTVYVDPTENFEFKKLADHSLNRLSLLLTILKTPSLSIY